MSFCGLFNAVVSSRGKGGGLGSLEWSLRVLLKFYLVFYCLRTTANICYELLYGGPPRETHWADAVGVGAVHGKSFTHRCYIRAEVTYYNRR